MDNVGYGPGAQGGRACDPYPQTRGMKAPPSDGGLTDLPPSNASLTALPQRCRAAQLPEGTGPQRFVLSERSPSRLESGSGDKVDPICASSDADAEPLNAETLRSAGFPIDLASYLLVCLAADDTFSRSDVDALLRMQTVVDETRAAFPFGRANVKGDDPSGPRRYALSQYHLTVKLLDRRAENAPEFSGLPNADNYCFLRGVEAAASSFIGSGRCESFTDVAAAKLEGKITEGESAQRAFSKKWDHVWLQLNRAKPEFPAIRPEPVVVDAWAGPHPVLVRHGGFACNSSLVHLEPEMNHRDIGWVAACADAALTALQTTTTVEETLRVTWKGSDPDEPDAAESLDELIEAPEWDEPSVINRAWVNEILDRPENKDRRRMMALAVTVARAMGVLPQAAPYIAQAIVDAADEMSSS